MGTHAGWARSFEGDNVSKPKVKAPNRRRPVVHFSLSIEAIAILHEIAERSGKSRSEVVDEALFALQNPLRARTKGARS
jgi:hypothetical protein